MSATLPSPPRAASENEAVVDPGVSVAAPNQPAASVGAALRKHLFAFFAWVDGPTAFVWSIWAAMVTAGIVFVLTYCSRHVPHWEEWVLLYEPFTPSFLWAQYHEHRFPLGKVIWLGLLKLTDYNFQVGIFLEIAAMAGMAAAMILGVRRLRGRTAYSDAFFPLALLTFGQTLAFLWWLFVVHLVAPLLACTLLLLLLRSGAELTFRRVLGAGLCLVALPLCGAGGLPYTVLFSFWFAGWAWVHWRSGQPSCTRQSMLVLGLVAFALLLVVLFFLGWTLDESGTKRFEAQQQFQPTVAKVLTAAVKIVSVGFGTSARSGWPYWGGLVLGLALLTGGLLLYRGYTQPEERFRILALLLFLGAWAGMALRMAMARAVLGEDYIFSIGHYTSIMLPALCCMYLAWELYAAPAFRGLVPMCLFTAVVCLFSATTHHAIQVGEAQRAIDRKFVEDVHSGLPVSLLAERYQDMMPGLDDFSVDEVTAYFELARRTSAGLFRHVKPDAAWVEEELSRRSTADHQIAWSEDDLAVGTGNAPTPSWLRYQLDRPRFVHAVRLRFRFEDPDTDAANMSLLFGRSAPGAPAVPPQDTGSDSVRVPLRLQECRYSFVVNQTIDHFVLIPDLQPFRLRLFEVTLLLPPEEE